jgi:flagellar export protein FliJ
MARRFQFRLDALLRVRQLREREAKRRLSATAAEIALLDRLDQQTHRMIERQERQLLEMQQGGRLDAAALVRVRAWIAHLRATILQRRQLREPLLAGLKQLQEQLRRARIETKTIEKLRERRRAQYRRDLARDQQAAADELARNMHTFERDTSEPGALDPACADRT